MYHKRINNLYDPVSKLPFKISRSKIDLFLECPRCFYLDRRLGIGRPSLPGFSLNNAVDQLLKKEFDLLRKKHKSHKLMKLYHIDAVPFDHPELPVWRDDAHRFTGANILHQPTNLIVDGIIDDIWVSNKGELHIVDYKSTSTDRVLSLDDEYKKGYKRQMEIYQWIFQQKNFPVSNTGYFVFANAGKNRPVFDGKLEFELSIITYTGNNSWMDSTLLAIKKCLDTEAPDDFSSSCEYCCYIKTIKDI